MQIVDVDLASPLLCGIDSPISDEGKTKNPSLSTEELKNATQWTEQAHLSSDRSGEVRGNKTITFQANHGFVELKSIGICCGIFTKLKFLVCDSPWPLSLYLAVAFLGFWLPKKRKSIWPLAFVPVFLLLFGIGAHLYFILSSGHKSVHIGSKVLLTSLWISGFCSYVLALYYLRYQSLRWITELSRNQFRAINTALVIGLLLVSLVLFGDVYYQVIFDLVNIKGALLESCKTERVCDAVFYALAVSVYWGLYSSVAVCCVFFALCLAMTNDLTKGYERISKCIGDVRDTLVIHRQVRDEVGERVNDMKTWFLIHMLFYVVVLLANIFEWWEATRDLRYAYEFMAQISGTLVVAYKFFFPFVSASYVTWYESTLAQDLNDKVDFRPGEALYSRHDLEVFLQQSRRRGYGFRVFKVQFTITIAIFSLLGSGFGLIHNLTS